MNAAAASFGLLDGFHGQGVDAMVDQPCGLSVNVLDLPTEHGEGLYPQFASDIGDPEDDLAELRNDGERILVDHPQTKDVLLEMTRAFEVSGRHEGDWRCG